MLRRPRMKRAPDDVLSSKLSENGPPPRIVLRNLPFSQSRNILQIIHNHGLKITRLTRHDFFHVFLRIPTFHTIVLLLSMWTAGLLFFAGIYMAIDPKEPGPCRLRAYEKPIIFATAFAQSAQTGSCVGYTLPLGVNALFAHCPALQIATYAQMGISMMLNAFIVAIIIAKVTNKSNRAVQVVFSDKALVSVVNGQVRFQVRIFDVNARHPVVEPHVRLYAVKRDRPVPRALRVVQPNDALGAHLFLSLPQVLSHNIDLYSILHPPRPDNPVLENHNGLDLRQADSLTCKRDDVVCRVCSDTFAGHDKWVRHVQYRQIAERMAGVPLRAAHRAVRQVELDLNTYKPTHNLQVLQQHFEEEISEVICVVEGKDALTSGSFSAMHSYRASDIVWSKGSAFHPCISADTGIYRVDLDRFHQIVEKLGGRRQQMSSRYHDSFFSDMEKGSLK